MENRSRKYQLQSKYEYGIFLRKMNLFKEITNDPIRLVCTALLIRIYWQYGFPIQLHS